MHRRVGKIQRKGKKNILASATKVNALCPLGGTVIAICGTNSRIPEDMPVLRTVVWWTNSWQI